VRFWSVDTGKFLRALEGHVDWVNSVAFSSDGILVASGSSDNTAQLWLITDKDTPQQTPKSHGDCVAAVAFSPNGLVVASASSDKTVWLWSAATGEAIWTLKGHSNKVDFVTFSPDSKVVASASSDNTIRFWSVDAGDYLGLIGLVTASYPPLFDWYGQRLLTDAGAFSFGHLLQPTQIANPHIRGSPATSLVRALPDDDQNCRSKYGISKDCSWITQDGKNILWLPVNCRPANSAVFGSTVAIGSHGGRVLIMRFQSAL
jgi:WD40 repeat protein